MNLSFPQKTILQMLGPSIIFIALSVSGGELLLWPDLIRTYGLTMLIFIPVILLLQFSVNMEIERYTVVTGKNTLRALIQESPWIQFLFPFAITISLMWPAWISTAGNILAVSLGMPEKGIILSLLLLGGLLTLWQSKRSYSIIEMIAKGGLLCVLFIVGYILYRLFNADTIYTSFATGTFIPHGKDALLFISALAYGGVAGVLNLVQSDWVKKKGYAAAGVASPESISWESTDTKKAWRAWWKLIVREHAWLFLFGNIVGILMLGSLAALTLSGTSAKGFGILAFQVQELNTLAAPLGSLFGIGVCLIFIMAQMAIFRRIRTFTEALYREQNNSNA